MILKNFTLVNADETIYNAYVKIENGLIVEVGENTFLEGIDLSGKIVMPGFIDRHTHGACGYDVMDNSIESIDEVASNALKEGVTSILLTTLTQDLKTTKEVIEKCSKSKIKNILGVHLEGPFINENYKGAQNKNFIKKPNIADLKELLSVKDGFVKQITYAPELTDLEFTKFVTENKVIASVGHSSASNSIVKEHVTAGLNSITHFYNAQSPHHHRNPGVVTAGLESSELTIELIVDGIHVERSVVNLTYKIKGASKITLVTDSMRAKDLVDGTYDLGGLVVEKKDDSVKTTDGVLAGSILHYNEAVKNMFDFTNCTLNEIVEMTSLNSAKLLKLEKSIGKIKKGYFANLVVLNDDFSVCKTIINGEILYESN